MGRGPWDCLGLVFGHPAVYREARETRDTPEAVELWLPDRSRLRGGPRSLSLRALALRGGAAVSLVGLMQQSHSPS